MNDAYRPTQQRTDASAPATDLTALVDYLRGLPQPVRAPDGARITRVTP